MVTSVMCTAARSSCDTMTLGGSSWLHAYARSTLRS